MTVYLEDKSVVDKNDAHWIIEDGDLDCAYCSECGHAATLNKNFNFSLTVDGYIKTEFPAKCHKCGRKINTVKSTGHCADIIDDLLREV